MVGESEKKVWTRSESVDLPIMMENALSDGSPVYVLSFLEIDTLKILE